MKYKFSDLVDTQKLNTLMETFYKATGIPSGIIDVEGNIIVSVGWQKICRDFHRKSSQTERLCRRSDDYIKGHLSSADPFIWYKCENGLIDAAAPIIIGGEHLATVFQGQFLFEQPDFNYFKNQAKKYNFDEGEYLDAVSRIPIYSVDKLDSIMLYFTQLAEMLAEMGLAKLSQIELQTKELEESDCELFRIFGNIPSVAIQGYDLNGNITFWNAASQGIYGLKSSAVINRKVNEVLEGEAARKIIKMIKAVSNSDKPHGPEERVLRTQEGNEKTVYSTIFPIHLYRGKEFICMDVDVTEKRNLEKELFRIDRLHLIGEMAASIGHEIRNPMTTVRGYLQMLQKKQEFQGYGNQFSTMIEELDRANQIITEFLSLAKDKSVDKKINNLNRIINVMMPLIYADAIMTNKNIRLNLNEIPDLPMDEKEIRQLLLNLVRNGLEAMIQSGELEIKTFREDNEVVLAIKDNGTGIPYELWDRIGTPFFTTKPQGTGLGLAVCYSVAARHQAKIVIESSSAGTTVFTRFVI
ncbi:PocR ligand-binding domain-containing protein [Sporomusa sp.]|uniref:PocR ligand-binding domain-containing protein n=1 Tax=Sporomusa sp. TaxID=2078658 RepID=UPI002C77C2EC|nr:PocR ligand-binding domain-containing protein [Sporomusa sp.]HWR44251.1 PocR ligand-binding domain-containing protein [Sporomusa sp.]